jgi:WD40 repeat protein
MANEQSVEILSPYPGLRPFLDTESSIFFGRYSQSSEIIERLSATHFVAILGGSGSGKSSLIRAGVIPELRGYGIQAAGDFWVPVLVTPGTNLSKHDIPAAERETPIDRVARKFVQLLRTKDVDEAAHWQAEAVSVLRESGGFGALVNRFSDRLDLPAGPDPQKANVMLVLDQFEELFHPSNKDVAECETLVSQVLDHFYSPHPRVYLVITMRSEHLNDCAAYLRLPDAINKASYLVRRLDPAEIDESIIEPPRRYLRMRARASNDRRRFPSSFAFDDAVLGRIRDDVEAIHADPDHLALLQHLLARLWETGCRRAQAEGRDIPESIRVEDLACAVGARLDGGTPPLPNEGNVLRLCLENWAQSIFDRIPEAGKFHADALLRRLAFKDPNTGMYTQQRLRIEDAVLLLGDAALPRAVLSGFLPPYDYILWDDERPAHVTIKVFHESFIRGWRHFLELIDKEAEVFDEFFNVVKETHRWTQDRSDGLLLDGARLNRVREFKFDDVLGDAAASCRLFDLLQLKHGTAPYRVTPEEVLMFVVTSNDAEVREAERRADEARQQEQMKAHAQENARHLLETERDAATQRAEIERLRAQNLEDMQKVAAASSSRNKKYFALTALLAVISVIAAVTMFNLKRTADESTRMAQHNQQLAEASKQEAVNNRRTAVFKQLEADERTLEAQGHKQAAEEKRKEAEQNAKTAQDNEALAKAAVADAKRSAAAAIEERNRLLSFRLYTHANLEMKSSTPNIELATLLALEALTVPPVSRASEAMEILRDTIQATPIRLRPGAGAGHAAAVRGVAIDAAGQRVATASEDSTVKLWDAASGKELVTIKGHGGAVLAVAFSTTEREGRSILASGSYDDTARLWDATDGREMRRFSGHQDTVTSVAFSAPAEKLLATGSEDRTAKIWDIETGRERQQFRGHSSAVRGVALSPDGKTLATASDDGTAKLWDSGSGKEMLNISGHSRAVRAVAFNRDGTLLATASDDRTVKVWELPAGKLSRTLTLTSPVQSVAFSLNGTGILTGTSDGIPRIWDRTTGKPLTPGYMGHQDAVYAVAFSRDGTQFVTGSKDRTARIWRESEYETALKAFGSGDVSQFVASSFSADGLQVITHSGESAVIWDAATGIEKSRFSGHGAKLSVVALSRDGVFLATAGDSKLAKVWRVTDADARPQTLDYEDWISAASFSPDGRRLAVGLRGGKVKISDVDSKRELSLEGHKDKVLGIAFSPDGKHLATGSYDDTARIWDAVTGKLLQVLTGHEGTINRVAFSPDGTQVATASDDKSAKLWDARSGNLLWTMVGHSSRVRNVYFVPSGNDLLIGTTSDDQTARLWDAVAKKEERTPLRGHTADVHDVVVQPKHRRYLTVGADRTIRAHAQTEKDLFDLAQSKVTRKFEAEECRKYKITSDSCAVAYMAEDARKRYENRLYREAVVLYNQIHAQDPKRVSANTWNDLCWYAAKDKLASAVVDGACEHAVKYSNGNANMVDSRGLARALAGRTAGAIRDFEVYVNDSKSDDQQKKQRQHWISELRGGRNPFTDAVLKGL